MVAPGSSSHSRMRILRFSFITVPLHVGLRYPCLLVTDVFNGPWDVYDRMRWNTIVGEDQSWAKFGRSVGGPAFGRATPTRRGRERPKLLLLSADGGRARRPRRLFPRAIAGGTKALALCRLGIHSALGPSRGRAGRLARCDISYRLHAPRSEVACAPDVAGEEAHQHITH